MSAFKILFYTKGYFVKDPGIRYEGGDVFGFNMQDVDYWSFFEAIDLVKSIQPEFDMDTVKMWWKHENGNFEDLKRFKDDGDDIEVSVFVVEHMCDIEIFCEPKPESRDATFMDMVKEKGKGKPCESSDDE